MYLHIHTKVNMTDRKRMRKIREKRIESIEEQIEKDEEYLEGNQK